VENLVREAFWNKSHPGADEHFLLHKLRNHPDCIPELNNVICDNDQILGHIIYSHGKIVSEGDPSVSYPVITFGPVAVHKEGDMAIN
jgi:predicted N-acetyltransferase YhbS